MDGKTGGETRLIKEDNGMSKIRLGLIGVGNIGTAHLNNVLSGQCPEVEITAVADRRASRREWSLFVLSVYPSNFTRLTLFLSTGPRV